MGNINRIENAKANSSIDVLKKISKAFEVSADYSLDDLSDKLSPVEIKDKSTIFNLFDSVLTKKKFKGFFEKELISHRQYIMQFIFILKKTASVVQLFITLFITLKFIFNIYRISYQHVV